MSVAAPLLPCVSVAAPLLPCVSVVAAPPEDLCPSAPVALDVPPSLLAPLELAAASVPEVAAGSVSPLSSVQPTPSVTITATDNVNEMVRVMCAVGRQKNVLDLVSMLALLRKCAGNVVTVANLRHWSPTTIFLAPPDALAPRRFGSPRQDLPELVSDRIVAIPVPGVLVGSDREHYLG